MTPRKKPPTPLTTFFSWLITMRDMFAGILIIGSIAGWCIAQYNSYERLIQSHEDTLKILGVHETRIGTISTKVDDLHNGLNRLESIATKTYAQMRPFSNLVPASPAPMTPADARTEEPQ